MKPYFRAMLFLSLVLASYSFRRAVLLRTRISSLAARRRSQLPRVAYNPDAAEGTLEPPEQEYEDQPQPLTPAMNREIRADFEALLQTTDPLPDMDRAPTRSIQGLLNKALVLNFFVVVGFLVWFLSGVVLQSSYPAVLLGFQGIFQPVVVPALTVLMVGSVATGVAEKLPKRSKTKD